MADVTFGVKVNEELKQKLTKIIKDSGMQGKDFMQNLVNIYEMENTKKSTPEIAQDIVELQYLTSRMNSIYINLAHRIDNIKNSNNEIYENQLKIQEEKILSLKEDLKCYQDKNNKLNKELELIKSSKEEMLNKISSLEDINNSNKLLIKEYNEKLYDFSQQLNDFKKISEESIKDKQYIDNLKNNNDALKSSLEKLSEENKEKLLKKDYQISSLEKNIKIIMDENKKALETMKDKLIIEKEREVLQLEKDYNLKINSIIDDYNSKIKSLLDERENIHKTNSKDS
ncbi:hypothetical protein [Clostridium sp. KNHs214]|uniref:hypothetical protein n=1 Tax=Clostridium sp. KNHs214 TaxID=1540257 RepID=UPI00054D7B67|nr:hypothetical protein [Clostridium sp. KNHs214]